MRWVHLFCLGAAALLTACGLGVQYPEFATKQYRLTGTRLLPGTDIRGPATYYRDGERLRYEGLTDAHGVATIIYDPARSASYLLEAPTSRRRLFAGIATQPTAMLLTEADAQQPLEVAWAALGSQNVKSSGRCRVAGEGGVLWRPREPIAPGIVRTACITPDGIVLQLTENDAVLFEATSLERGPQAASLFVIPESYRIVGNAELAEASGATMDASATNDGTPQTRTPR